MDMLISILCEIELLCNGSEPNWFGWSVLGMAVVLGAMAILFFTVDFFSR